MRSALVHCPASTNISASCKQRSSCFSLQYTTFLRSMCSGYTTGASRSRLNGQFWRRGRPFLKAVDRSTTKPVELQAVRGEVTRCKVHNASSVGSSATAVYRTTGSFIGIIWIESISISSGSSARLAISDCTNSGLARAICLADALRVSTSYPTRSLPSLADPLVRVTKLCAAARAPAP
eukprot:4297267-Prymnesium_polylepis.2